MSNKKKIIILIIISTLHIGLGLFSIYLIDINKASWLSGFNIVISTLFTTLNIQTIKEYNYARFKTNSN